MHGYFGSALRVSWHLPLLPEHLPCFVYTRTWTLSFPAVSSTDWATASLFYFILTREMCQYKIITWGMDQKGKSHSSAKHGQVLSAGTSTRGWAPHPSEEPLGFGWRRDCRCISNNKVAGKLCNTGYPPSVMRCSYKWRCRMYIFFSVGAGLTVNSRLCCWWAQQDVVVLNRVPEILVVGGKLRVNLPLKTNKQKHILYNMRIVSPVPFSESGCTIQTFSPKIKMDSGDNNKQGSRRCSWSMFPLIFMTL